VRSPQSSVESALLHRGRRSVDSNHDRRNMVRGSRVHGDDNKPAGRCNWCHAVRAALQASEFYNGSFAWSIRFIMQSRCCSMMMMLALFVALVLPDASKLLDVSDNVWSDVIMFASMVIFVCEMSAMSLTDATYLFSFFHVMDMVGTMSMVFDISFLLGVKADEPTMPDRDSAQSRIMLLRATRAARVGARAGRLTRILRVCRCLLDVDDADDGATKRAPKKADPDSREEGQAKKNIAKVISARLGNLLATQVA